MIYNPGILGIIPLTIGLFPLGRKLQATRAPVVLKLLMFTSGLLPAAFMAIYYLHIFAPPLWYYEVRSLPCFEVSAAAAGLSFGMLSAFTQRRRWISSDGAMGAVLMLLALVFASIPHLKNFIRPLHAERLENKRSGKFSLQTSGATCGPASLSSLFALHGEKITEREIARAAYTSASGTEAWYLMRFVRKRGFNTRLDTARSLRDVQVPAMIGVLLPGGVGHFIVLLKIEGDTVHLMDPSFGEARINLARFGKEYRFRGFVLRISPPVSQNPRDK